MKILNLDKLNTSSGRFLTIGAKRHEISAMSVENFLTISQAAQQLIERVATPAEHIKGVIDTIVLLVPTLAPKDLAGLDLDGLNVVSEFVRGGDVDQAEVVEASTEEAKAGN